MKFKDCFFQDSAVRGTPVANWHKAWSMYRHNGGYRVRTRYRFYCWGKSKQGFIGKILEWYFRKILLHLNLYNGVEINCRQAIGPGLSFPHPHDIVIGREAKVGKNVTIFNGVTLGGKADKNGNTHYPVIEDDCILYPGAKILGGIVLGKGTIVGANAVVLHSCPPGSILGGIPAVELHPSHTGADA